MRFRLLSLIILSCVMLLVIKVADLIERKQTIAEAFLASDLSAQEHEKEVTEGEGEQNQNAEKSEGVVIDEQNQFTQTEVDILQRLSQRREKLEEWQTELETKENILNITQTKIDQKIAELRDLKKQVEDLLAQYNQKEKEKTDALVKIYESMKAKSAAQIFSELDHATLMPVMSRMKEKKVALILANMSPKQATELTTKFVEFRQLNQKDK